MWCAAALATAAEPVGQLTTHTVTLAPAAFFIFVASRNSWKWGALQKCKTLAFHSVNTEYLLLHPLQLPQILHWPSSRTLKYQGELTSVAI